MNDQPEITQKKYPRGHHPNTHKNITEKAAQYRFGQPGGNPHHSQTDSNSPWDIRKQLRYLARQQIDPNDPKAMSKLLPPSPTVAQVIAANALAKAARADMRAVEYATDQISGKLAQPTINADLETIMRMSDEELMELVKDEVENYARSYPSTEGGGGEDGAGTPDGSQGDASREDAGADQAADSSGV